MSCYLTSCTYTRVTHRYIEHTHTCHRTNEHCTRVMHTCEHIKHYTRLTRADAVYRTTHMHLMPCVQLHYSHSHIYIMHHRMCTTDTNLHFHVRYDSNSPTKEKESSRVFYFKDVSHMHHRNVEWDITAKCYAHITEKGLCTQITRSHMSVCPPPCRS